MYMTVAFLVHAEDVKSAGISELFASANNALQSGDFQAAIPILEEVVERTSGIDQDQGRQTCQTCRFQLTRAFFQIGSPAEALPVIDAYLLNEPRQQEALMLRMQAQAYFDMQEWESVQNLHLDYWNHRNYQMKMSIMKFITWAGFISSRKVD